MLDQLLSLADLHRAGSTRKACALGVVTDCTAPYKGKDQVDWIVRLKIIDHSFSPATAGPSGYCTVFFFSDRPDSLPRVTELGSIVYLRRADFSIWQGGNLKAVLGRKKYASWALFSGDPAKLDLSPLETSREAAEQDDPFDLRPHLCELRSFSLNYFKENELQMVPRNDCSKDFDFIFEVVACEARSGLYKLTLRDGEGVYLTFSHAPFEEKTVVKIRSIAEVDWGDPSILKPNDFTWAMSIPAWMPPHSRPLSTLPHIRGTDPRPQP